MPGTKSDQIGSPDFWFRVENIFEGLKLIASSKSCLLLPISSYIKNYSFE